MWRKLWRLGYFRARINTSCSLFIAMVLSMRFPHGLQLQNAGFSNCKKTREAGAAVGNALKNLSGKEADLDTWKHES